MAKSDAKKIKELNKVGIRKAFSKNHVQTAASLSKETTLSVVTVNALLHELMEDKEIEVAEELSSNGGRPATQYKYCERYQCTAVIYGYYKAQANVITIVVTDIFGQCIYREIKELQQIKENSFEEMLDKAFAEVPSIKVIAFGLPGEEENDRIIFNDYKALVGDTFMKHYRERYQVPVHVVNDINAAVNGYYRVQKKGIKNVAGIFFPRAHGPGMGIVINGKIYTGRHRFAGEVEFLPDRPQWEKLDYQKEEEIIPIIARLIITISCIVAADRIVLYGDFWKEGVAERLEEVVNKQFLGHYRVHIEVSDRFAEDFERGLICRAIQELKNVEGLIK